MFMNTSGEQERTYEDVIDTFEGYTRGHIDELTSLMKVLSAAMPILEQFNRSGGVNEKLEKAGRLDLLLHDPVAMNPVREPGEMQEHVNFIGGFHMPTGHRKRVNPSRWEPEDELVLPTAEEILQLKALPREENSYEGLRDSGVYPALYMHNHAVKPAFLRLINIFPDFTVDVVMTTTRSIAMDEPTTRNTAEAKLFVAYQLMSRLVDRGDGGQVLDDAGKVVKYYLDI